MSDTNTADQFGSNRVKRGLAEMLKGGVIMDVVTAEQGERAAVAAYDARARLEEQGLATALELMQAQTAQVQARLNLINAHIGLRVARVQLDHALGRDVKQVG